MSYCNFDDLSNVGKELCDELRSDVTTIMVKTLGLTNTVALSSFNLAKMARDLDSIEHQLKSVRETLKELMIETVKQDKEDDELIKKSILTKD